MPTSWGSPRRPVSCPWRSTRPGIASTTSGRMTQMSDDAAHIDELPEDLDASAAVNITFPNNSRRRIPAVLYILLGLASIAAYAAKKGSTPLVDVGLVWA